MRITQGARASLDAVSQASETGRARHRWPSIPTCRLSSSAGRRARSWHARALFGKRRDPIGEATTERCFEPVERLLREGGNKLVCEVTTKCCREPVEGWFPSSGVATVRLLDVREQTGRACGTG